MSVTVKRWRLENAEIEQTGANGVRIVETIIVYGLTPGTDDKILYDAMFTAGVPTYATAHNYFTSAFVKKIRVMGISGDQAKLQVTYETPQASASHLPENGTFVLSDGTTLEMTTTQKDADDNYLSVHYDRVVAGVTKWSREIVGNAQILIPRRTLSAAAVLTTRPNTAMRQCVGKVNNVAWQGEPQRTWLCAGVESVTEDLEQTFKVKATWIHNEETWDAYLAWMDENGQIPSDIGTIDRSTDVSDRTDANGILRAIIYKQADFRAAFGF